MFHSLFAKKAPTQDDTTTPVPATPADVDPVDDPLQWINTKDIGGAAADRKTSSAAEATTGLDRTAELQAKMSDIRHETEAIVTEEHPEIERKDTVEKAHERGEL